MKTIGPLLKPRRRDGGTLPSYSLSYPTRLESSSVIQMTKTQISNVHGMLLRLIGY